MSFQQITTATRRSRKAHACWVCGTGRIQPGDTYQANTNVFDGRIYTLNVCIACDALTNDVWLWAYQDDDGLGPDDYAIWADEHTDDPRAQALLDRLNHDKGDDQ